MVGAFNLDLGTYVLPDGREETGITAWLDPGHRKIVVGKGSQVQIGDRIFVVTDVFVRTNVFDNEIRLSDPDEGA
jgi:hypothetical protein